MTRPLRSLRASEPSARLMGERGSDHARMRGSGARRRERPFATPGRRDVGEPEVRTLEQQALAARPGQGVGGAIGEVQCGRVKSLAEPRNLSARVHQSPPTAFGLAAGPSIRRAAKEAVDRCTVEVALARWVGSGCRSSRRASPHAPRRASSTCASARPSRCCRARCGSRRWPRPAGPPACRRWRSPTTPTCSRPCSSAPPPRRRACSRSSAPWWPWRRWRRCRARRGGRRRPSRSCCWSRTPRATATCCAC